MNSNPMNNPDMERRTQIIDDSSTRYSGDNRTAPKRATIFPFRQTPSGNFKVSSNQVVFETTKVSVLVSNPSYTTVNLDDQYGSTCKSITLRGEVKPKTLFGLTEKPLEINMPPSVPSYDVPEEGVVCHDDEPDWESDLRIFRRGFYKSARIDWQKVNIPPKTNLQHLLLKRIRNCCKTDTVVCIGTEQFNCHALVLQCYSRYFDDMQLLQMREPIELPESEVSPDAFHLVYSWMVSDQSAQLLSQDTVLDVCLAADYLNIDELKMQCWAFLDSEDLFVEDTAFVMFMQAKAIGNTDVMQVMIPKIMKFFLALVSSRDFLELEVSEVAMLLESNHICVHSEMEVFMAAVRWLTHKWTERKQHLGEIMTCIRFGLIASWQLVDIRRNPENPQFIQVMQCDEVRKMVEDGLAYSILKNWYSGIAKEYCNILGLTEPAPRNWVGDPIPYITYRQFAKDLNLYRSAYMAERNRCTEDGVTYTGKNYELPVLPALADATPSMANPFPVNSAGHPMNNPPEALAQLLGRREFIQAHKSASSHLEAKDRGDFVDPPEAQLASHNSSTTTVHTEIMEPIDIGINSENSMEIDIDNLGSDTVDEDDYVKLQNEGHVVLEEQRDSPFKGERTCAKIACRSYAKHSSTTVNKKGTRVVSSDGDGNKIPPKKCKPSSDDHSLKGYVETSATRSETAVDKHDRETSHPCSENTLENKDNLCQSESKTVTLLYEETVNTHKCNTETINLSSTTVNHHLKMKRSSSDTKQSYLYEADSYSSKSSSCVGYSSRVSSPQHQVPSVLDKLDSLNLLPRNSYLLFRGHRKLSMQYMMKKRVLGLPAKRHMNHESLFLQDYESVLVLGGVDPHNAHGTGKNFGKDIYRFVPEKNVWEVVGELPEPRMHHAVVFHRGKVYLAGGADPRVNDARGRSVIVSAVSSFDPVTRCWVSECSMRTPRKCFGLVAMQGKLYAIGGQDSRGRAMKSMERFDPKRGLWEEMAPLSLPRLGLAAAAYQGRIWVAGGMTSSISDPLCGEVECYDPSRNEWTTTTPLKFPRVFARFIVENERLYIVGGAGCVYKKSSVKTSVQDIDMWDDSVLQWVPAAHLAIPRHGHSVAYLGTQILIICGVTTAYMRAVNNVEAYCCKRGRWVKGINKLPVPLSGLGSVTLPPAKNLKF